jgi:hypothetical protein
MGKFDKYVNRKMKINIDGVDMEIEFLVRDRIELAALHETKKQDDQYNKLIDFCLKLLKRSYPSEPDGAFDGFLSTNLEKFIEEIMVGANLATREQFAKKSGDFRKKENDTGGISGIPPAKQE